jgi:hypothetical protein
MAVVDGCPKDMGKRVKYLNLISKEWELSPRNKSPGTGYTHQHDIDPEPVRAFFKDMINLTR